jgi:hypothetical protein
MKLSIKTLPQNGTVCKELFKNEKSEHGLDGFGKIYTDFICAVPVDQCHPCSFE